MYLVRNVDPSDLNDLYELSGLVTFINLPKVIDLIKKPIKNMFKYKIVAGKTPNTKNDIQTLLITLPSDPAKFRAMTRKTLFSLQTIVMSLMNLENSLVTGSIFRKNI